jgi:hypothetical protein
MISVVRSVRQSLEELARDFEPGRLSGEQAVEMVEELSGIRRLIDGVSAKSAKRVDETRADKRTSDRDAAALCARVAGTTVREARRAIETAEKLETLRATDAAVRAGALSARQAAMIVDAATINPEAEDDLLATTPQGLMRLKEACIAARAVIEDGAKRAERQHAGRFFRTWSNDDGMLEGRFRVTPEVGGRLTQVINAETQRTFLSRHRDGVREPHDRCAADAFVALVLGTTENAKGANTTVHVVIDHAALVRGDTGDGETCEIPGVGPVAVGWVRDLLGSAFVTAVVKKGRDITTVAHLGRSIPAELQTAMIVGGRECEVENCCARGYLERDHSEVDYAKGGPTAYWNLAWLCYLHHRLKSSGWKLGPPDPKTGKRSLVAPDAADPAAA